MAGSSLRYNMEMELGVVSRKAPEEGGAKRRKPYFLKATLVGTA
jgi:hypothetical protein